MFYNQDNCETGLHMSNKNSPQWRGIRTRRAETSQPIVFEDIPLRRT